MLDWLPADLAALIPLDHLREIERSTGAPAWLMVGSAGTMFAAWTACYYAIVRQCFRDKTYGVPIVNTALNISWEFIFAFELFGPLPSFYFPLRWGHRFWLIFDVFNIIQILKYGKAVQTSNWSKRHFYQIVAVTFVGCGPAIYLFMDYFNDVMGVGSAMLIDLVMAVLFIRLYTTATADLRGLSYPAAWYRLIGDTASFVFLYYWWPAQFVNGVMANQENIPRFENIQEPRSFLFLNALYVVIPLIDLFYIYLLRKSRRELRDAEAASPRRAAAASG